MQVARGEHAHKIKFYPCELGKLRVPLVFSASFSGTACGLYKRATPPNRVDIDGESHSWFVPFSVREGLQKKVPEKCRADSVPL